MILSFTCRFYRLKYYLRCLTPSCSTEDSYKHFISTRHFISTWYIRPESAGRFNYTIIIYLSGSQKTGCSENQVFVQTVSRTKLYLYHFLYNIQIIRTICSMSRHSKQKVPLDSSCQNTFESRTPWRNCLVCIGYTCAHNPTKSSNTLCNLLTTSNFISTKKRTKKLATTYSCVILLPQRQIILIYSFLFSILEILRQNKISFPTTYI